MTNQIQEIKDLIQKLVRSTSLENLKAYSQIDEIQISTVESNIPVFGHWMILVLVSGLPLRLIFKIHFMSTDAQCFASQAFAKKTVTKRQGIDFIQELSNLIVGKIKTTLEKYGFSVGMSLPLLTRGFDEVFFEKEEQNAVIFRWTDYWCLASQDAKMICSDILEFKDMDLISKIQINPNDTLESEGNIEFL